MVDAAIIMIENAHKHIEQDGGKKDRWQIIRDAAVEVGPTLFYSLLVITVSFIPVFTLQAQEGRLFKPLAFTKTYSMAAAALLSITLAPVLMGYFIRGKIPPEEKNPVNRFLIWAYHPCIDFIIRFRWQVIGAALAIVLWVFVPWDFLVTSRLPEGSLRNASAAFGKVFLYHGAVKRVRPKAMTACVIIAGLMPILWSHGAGADVMKRIATPMVGGVITSTLMELLVYPAIFFIARIPPAGIFPRRPWQAGRR